VKNRGTPEAAPQKDTIKSTISIIILFVWLGGYGGGTNYAELDDCSWRIGDFHARLTNKISLKSGILDRAD
jgi:hypothetical protein